MNVRGESTILRTLEVLKNYSCSYHINKPPTENLSLVLVTLNPLLNVVFTF